MCLILMAYRRLPGVELLLASNRDERLDRPAAFARRWEDAPTIVGGRDLEAGGTWLGVSRSGSLAAVTNIRDPDANSADAPSRGNLPVRFLQKKSTVAEFMRDARPTFASYNPFNLVLYDGDVLGVASNRSEALTIYEPGVHGISNGLPGANWPKVATGKGRLEALAASGWVSTKSVLEIMRDEDRAADETLPDTGVGLPLERVLSPAFIRSDGYGTRCTTIVRFHSDHRVVLDEYSYGVPGDIVNHEHVEFHVSSAPEP